MCIYMHIYIYIYVYIYIYTYLCICICICMCVYIYIYIDRYTYTYTHAYGDLSWAAQRVYCSRRNRKAEAIMCCDCRQSLFSSGDCVRMSAYQQKQSPDWKAAINHRITWSFSVSRNSTQGTDSRVYHHDQRCDQHYHYYYYYYYYYS